MSQRAEQFSCECGKQFSNRNDLERHRQNCAAAKSGQQNRGTGGNNPSSGNK